MMEILKMDEELGRENFNRNEECGVLKMNEELGRENFNRKEECGVQ